MGHALGWWVAWGLAAGALLLPGVARASPEPAYRVTLIAVPGATVTTARSINDSGTVVGEYEMVRPGRPDTLYHGFMFANGRIRCIDPPDAMATAIVGISNDGTVFGWYKRRSTQVVDAFTLKDGIYHFIGRPGYHTHFLAVGRDGEAVGISFPIDRKSVAFFRYRDGVENLTEADRLQPEIFAIGINDAGTIVGTGFGRRPDATETGFAVIGDGVVLSGRYIGFGINDAGVQIGAVLKEGGSSADVIVDRSGVHPVEYPGGRFADLVAIANSGDVLGSATTIYPNKLFILHQGVFLNVPSIGAYPFPTALNDRGQFVAVTSRGIGNSAVSYLGTPVGAGR